MGSHCHVPSFIFAVNKSYENDARKHIKEVSGVRCQVSEDRIRKSEVGRKKKVRSWEGGKVREGRR
jgi:hypothetical protein